MTAPSEEHDKYWIRALFADSDTPDYTGKWMLFVPVDQLDTAWAVIKQETEAGRLGISAKVATAKDNPNAASRDVRLICVYTRDSRDLDDVRRVLAALRALGYHQRLYYKEDNATLALIYGGGSASLYGSNAGTQIRQRRAIVEPEERLFDDPKQTRTRSKRA